MLLTVLCLADPTAAGPQDKLEVIQLKSRTAEEMIPVIRPLLGPEDTLTGTGYKLILRADPDTVREIKAVLEQLDQAPRNLLITVKRGDLQTAHERELSVSGTEEFDDKGRITIQGSEDDLDVDLDEHTTTRRPEALQQLRVAEGNRAFIYTGQSVPYPESDVSVGRAGPRSRTRVYSEGVSFRDVRSGFYVLPRVSGEQVTLEIQPVDESLNTDRSVNIQRTHTIVSGTLGEWIQIGGVRQRATEYGRKGGTTYRTHDSQDLDIYVKVELSD